MSESKPTLMQTIKDGLAADGYSGKAVVNLNKANPDSATITFTDSKGSVNASLTTKGNSFTLDFDGVTDPQRLKSFQGMVGKLFGHAELGVNSSAIKYAANGDAITTRVQEAEIATAQSRIAQHKAAVASTIGALRDEQVMRANGVAEHIVRDHTNYAIGQAATGGPTFVELAEGRAPKSRSHALANAVQGEFTDLMSRPVGHHAQSAVAPSLPVVPAGTHPDFAKLLTQSKAAANAAAEHMPSAGAVGRFVVAAATMASAGLAAAAQAPEGQRLEAAAKATKHAGAELLVPGITQTDTCKAQGVAWGNAGAGLGAAGLTAGVAYVTGGVGLLGAAATTTLGGAVGDKIGTALGEGVCRLAQAATSGMARDNRAMVEHKPTPQHAASAKMPDAVVAQRAATHGREGRG